MEGTSFGRYRLLGLLGRGGMGEVWRAYDAGTDRVVALKVLPATFAQDPKFEERFRREAHSAARLHHPHIVPIYDYGQIDGRLFVSMALIDGHDLAEEIARGPLTPARAVSIVDQTARALAAAHKVGLVHRDVKPSNILLGEDDDAYLIDFGIARAATDTGLTGTGNTLGTWAYMAPERFTSDTLDPRSDVYALACVLHEALTGTRPFPGDSLERQVAGHLHTPPPRSSTMKPGVPSAFDDVIATGMAKDPNQRYANSKDLAAAARAALGAPDARPAPQSRPPVVETVAIAAPAQPTPPETPPDVARRVTPGLTRSAAADATQAGPTSMTPSPQAQPRRKWLLLGGAAVAVAVILTVTAVTIPKGDLAHAPAYGEAVTLPFTGLRAPAGVAVDAAGTVYVADQALGQVWSLPADATAPTELPFTGLRNPGGVAVDASGTVYVTDFGNDRVWSLPADATTPTELPFTGLRNPGGVAVDASGTVYVTDQALSRVWSLPAGATAPTELPFDTPMGPWGVAVDASGTVYVTDIKNDRVLSLPAGAATQTELPFTGLGYPVGVAVDAAGAVYVADYEYDRVSSLPVGAITPTELPFTGQFHPEGVAVDASGAVYITSSHVQARVVKFPVM